jgi:hypothetical protein
VNLCQQIAPFSVGKIFRRGAVVRPTFTFRPVILAGIKKAATQLNVVGSQVRKFRLLKGWRQVQLARAMQLRGWAIVIRRPATSSRSRRIVRRSLKKPRVEFS